MNYDGTDKEILL